MSIKKIMRLFIFSYLLVTPLACFIAEPNPQLVDIPSLNRKDIRTLPRELVAWWKLNDIEGSTAFDSSGHNNHGRVYGATWSGNALSLDGMNNYVGVPGSANLNIIGSITIEAWIKRNVSGVQHSIVGKWLWVTGYPVDYRSYYLQVYSDDKADFLLSPDGSHANLARLRSRRTIAPNQWYHITGVYDGSSMKLYINGVLDNSMTYSGGIYSRENTPVAIGIQNHNGQPNTHFNGPINEVKIYNYARSSSEIQAEYNNNQQNIAITPDTSPYFSSAAWTTRAPMPTARTGFCVATVNGRIYAIGGVSGKSYLNINEEYDPARNRWSIKAPMPTPRANFAISVVNNKIYAMGGVNGQNLSLGTNEEYNPATNEWTVKANMTKKRNSLSAGTVNNKIYAIGGYDNSVYSFTTNEEYDPARNRWTAKAPIPVTIHAFTVAVANNKIYAIGGYNIMVGKNLDSNYEYDPVINRWTAKAPLPMARHWLNCGVINNQIYALGGGRYQPYQNPTYINYDNNEAYDPATNTWNQRQNMPDAGWVAVCAVDTLSDEKSKIYAFGDKNQTWQYDPSLDCPNRTTLPIANWKFNDIEGNTAFDSSGHNLHGRVYGATWSGNALSFDGRDDCVKVPESQFLRPARITVEAWIRPRRITQAVLMEKVALSVYPPQKGWQIFINTITEPKNNIVAWIGNKKTGKGTEGLAGNTIIQADRWYHIAMTYDGARLNLYVNGVLDGSKHDTTGIGDNSAASLTMGYSEYWNSNHFNGLMRDAKIYNYAKSQSEIQADYNRDIRDISFIESTNRSERPIAWWKFDEDSGAIVKDSSGHGNNGRVYGATWSGGSLSFDGKDDYVSISSSSSLNPTIITVSCWIKLNSYLQNTNFAGWPAACVYKTNDANTGTYIVAYGLFLKPNTGIPSLLIQIADTASYCVSGPALSLGTWNHLVGTYNGSIIKLYVNGALVGSTPTKGEAISSGNYPLSIGRSTNEHASPAWKSYLNGTISDLKIYNYARSAEEIQADYNNFSDIGLTGKNRQPITSGGDWTLLNPDNAPSARYGTAMAYDSNRKKTVIFGGTFTGKDSIEDTWEWDGKNWSRKRPVHSPSTRGFSAMAYDPVHKKTVLFGGGYYGSVYFNDTWEWNGRDWRLIYLANKPSPRVWPIMVYDSARQRMVLFGGFYEGRYLNDTWEWDGKNWRRLYPEISPPGRHYHTMAYDAERQKTVLFGGWTAWDTTTNQTWEWDGTNWAFKSPAHKPSARTAPAMAYDPVRGKTILFGGQDASGYLNDTWEWDGTDWIEVIPDIFPFARNQHKMVYDSNRRKIILFGGATIQGDSSNETWEYTNISQLKVK